MWPLLQQSFDSQSKFAKNFSKFKLNVIYFQVKEKALSIN